MPKQPHFEQYTDEDWQIMSEAHKTASLKLGRDHREHENANRLARTVMMLFDQGIKNKDILVRMAIRRELANEHLANELYSKFDSITLLDHGSTPAGKQEPTEQKRPTERH